jgi:hypothetical protein
MSIRFQAVLIAAPIASLFAAPAVAAPASSPFLGAWELDLGQMPATYGPPPKRVLYTFKDADDGRWITTVDITAPDGSVRHMEMTYRRDGQAGTSSGDLSEGDAVALASPASDVLVMSIAKERQLASVRTYTVSRDGGEMIEAAADVDPEGRPFVRTFHFRRAR